MQDQRLSRVFGWEFAQNLPTVLGIGLASRSPRIAHARPIALLGALGSALVITWTEQYKLAQPDRAPSARELAINGALFAAASLVALHATRTRSAGRLAQLGTGLGLMVGLGQWGLIKQSASDGLRHTAALALACPLILVAVRLSAQQPWLPALAMLLGATGLMSVTIVLLDY